MIQLTVLGLILGPIFRYNVSAFVILYIMGMSIIASVVTIFFLLFSFINLAFFLFFSFL